MIGRRPQRGTLLFGLAVAAVLTSGAGPAGRTFRVDDWDTQRPGLLDLSSRWRIYPPAAARRRLKHPPMIVMDSGRRALKLVTDAESVRIGRALSVDVREMPLLSWEWKALILPAGGDARQAHRNDQAGRVMLLFEGMKSILYVWDTSAPVGEWVHSDELEPFARVLIVVRSGAPGVGVWHRESRDVAADYRRSFDEPPRRVKWVGFESHSDDVKGRSSMLLGHVGFERRPPKSRP